MDLPVAAATVPARELRLELREPGGAPLVRLFAHDGGHWDPPPPERRRLRVDPPEGRRDAYAVLYLADNLPTVAQECGVLVVDHRDRCTWSLAQAQRYRVARYTHERPAVFLPIDGDNRARLGLAGPQRGYAAFQQAALALHTRFAAAVHGLSWESFHRGQWGRVYALWHEHKAGIGLTTAGAADFAPLAQDGEWLAFLAHTPDAEPIA